MKLRRGLLPSRWHVRATGCDLLSKKDKTPTSPTSPTPAPTTAIEIRGIVTSVTASTPPTGCGNLKLHRDPDRDERPPTDVRATCATTSR